ncbi:hypothetical protein GCM10010428_19140 [Actinosynnema pretiosum subsp. pretiosum]
MLEDRAADDLADALAREAEAGDQAVEGGGEHVLVRGSGVRAARSGERGAVAAEDGDPPGACHVASLVAVARSLPTRE